MLTAEKSTRLTLLALLMAAFAGLTVITTSRAIAAFTAIQTAPGVAVTSGCEEESLFALWRVAHHQPVYCDLAASPYASAYFNWLFYQGYGVVATITSHTQGDAAIPATARMLTVVGALLGAILLGVLGWRLLRPIGFEAALAGAFFGAFCFLGPLPGWWVCTVRPDIWAVTFEALGLIWFLLFQGSRRWLAVLGAAIIFYGAWAMKPNLIQALLATGLYLTVQRRWLEMVVLGGSSAVFYTLTFWLLGPTYRQALIAATTGNTFSLSIANDNTLSALFRTLPIIVLCFGTLCLPRSRATTLSSAATQLGLLGSPLAFILSYLSSAKMGAAPNYFLSTTLLLTLAAFGLASGRTKSWPLILSVGLATSLELALLFGHGRIDLQKESTDLAQRWQLWESAPEPRFSHDLRLNLPWLNSNSPPLVLAFNYPRDRLLQRKFEADGVGGLISQSYFASLLLPDDTTTSYDGALLEHYERGPSATGYTLYSRRPMPTISPAP